MTQSLFLSHHDDSTKRAMIDALTPERRAQLLANSTRGANVHGATTVKEALGSASLDFQVQEAPLVAMVDDTQGVDIPNRKALLRIQSGREPSVVGDVSQTYRVLQHEEAFAPATVLAERGEIEFVSAWEERGGAVIGLEGIIGATQLDLPGGEPDTLAHIMSLKTSHDGSTSTTADLFTVRLICLNGMTANGDAVRSIKVSHTARADERMQEATALILGMQAQAVEEADIFTRMARRRMSAKQFRGFAERVLDTVRTTITADTSDAVRARRHDEVAKLEDFFLHGQGNTGSTEYDAYNAFTDWVTPRRDAYEHAAQYAKALVATREGTGNRVRRAAMRELL